MIAASTVGESAVRSRPPVAPGLPLIGNAIDLADDPFAFLLKSYLTLGPVFRIGAFGRRYTVLAGPEANQFLLRGGAERCFDSAPIYRHIAEELQTKDYLVSTTGPRHREIRRMLRPAMSAESLEPYSAELFSETERIASSWRPGQRLNVLGMMHGILSELIGTALLGRKLNGLLPDALRFARYSIGSGLGGYPRAFRHAPHYRWSRRRMLAFFREALDHHRRVPPGQERRRDLMDAVLEARDSDGQPFPDDAVIANAQMAYSNTLLYAGPACSFMLYTLLKHPDVGAQVAREVAAAAREGAPTLARLRSLPTLKGALLESFRMHPIALATPRVVSKPFEFAGYIIPAGEPVLVAVTVCHYLPQIFPEPYKFDVGRHSRPDAKRMPGTLVPFGLGERSCLGQQLVESFMLIVVGALARGGMLEMDPPTYQLRKRVNPFSEPRDQFVVRVAPPRPTLAVPPPEVADAPAAEFGAVCPFSGHAEGSPFTFGM